MSVRSRGRMRGVSGAWPWKDTRGAALPLALFGLIALSVLVTSALLTASTDLALSRAHQVATRGLYAAEDAIERFLAARAVLTEPDEPLAAGEFPVGEGEGGFNLVVAELGQALPRVRPDGRIERRETFSVFAAPRGTLGRRVGALVQGSRSIEPFGFAIDAAITLGGDATMDAGSTISGGSGTDPDCEPGPAGSAVMISDGGVLKIPEATSPSGGIVEDTLSSAEMVDRVLDGRTLDQLADLAAISFGPRFAADAFNGLVSQWASEANHRWGCPLSLVAGCMENQASYFPVVAIDGGGGVVDIAGDHGQGVILVINGDARLHGQFRFAGIVIVQGAITVEAGVHLDGSVIAVGDSPSGHPGQSRLLSGSTIRFSRCRIESAIKSLEERALDEAPQRIATQTFGWFEAVR